VGIPPVRPRGGLKLFERSEKNRTEQNPTEPNRMELKARHIGQVEGFAATEDA